MYIQCRDDINIDNCRDCVYSMLVDSSRSFPMYIECLIPKLNSGVFFELSCKIKNMQISRLLLNWLQPHQLITL